MNPSHIHLRSVHSLGGDTVVQLDLKPSQPAMKDGVLCEATEADGVVFDGDYLFDAALDGPDGFIGYTQDEQLLQVIRDLASLGDDADLLALAYTVGVVRFPARSEVAA